MWILIVTMMVYTSSRGSIDFKPTFQEFTTYERCADAAQIVVSQFKAQKNEVHLTLDNDVTVHAVCKAK